MRNPTLCTRSLSCCLASMALCLSFGAETTQDKPKPQKVKPSAPAFYDSMDFGPYIADTIVAPNDNISIKGVAVGLGAKGKAGGLCFDIDLLRMSAGWTGGYLKLTGDAYDRKHSRGPEIVNQLVFTTKPVPGWSQDGTFIDPRSEPFGPLPAAYARFRGLYRNGEQIVLSYSVGAGQVLELPGMGADQSTLTRTFSFTDMAPTHLLIAELPQAMGKQDNDISSLTTGNQSVSVRLIGAPEGVTVRVADNRLILNLPSLSKATFTLALISGTDEAAAAKLRAILPSVNPATLIAGGPARWNEPQITSGTLGNNADAYAVDTIVTPDNNPWSSNLRFGGFDFFADGRAALSTWNGDVWIVGGIDAALAKITWRRFAAGLHQPLGLKVVNNQVYALCRNGLWRLHDLNNDGEADYYELFNGDIHATPAFHEFAFDLHTDKDGNFYHTKAGPVKQGGRGFETIAEHHGAIIKISKDGKTLERHATGFRAANGMGIGPNGEMTSGDNEGTWMPVCRLNFIKPGGFMGVMDLHHRDVAPTTYDPPICFMSHKIDNSSGAQVWATDNRWGPLSGNLLHLSYGKSAMFVVAWGMSGDIPQGGITPLPLSFNSGMMRARVNPKDGQVYVCGLKGWQTTAVRDGGFQRIRATGKPICVPVAMNVKSGAIELQFSDTLNPQMASDIENWSGQQWNYIWSANYGSPEVKPGTTETGRVPLPITGITLLPDGKTVRLAIDNLKPVMQFSLKYRITTAGGEAVNNEFHGTVNVVPQ